MEKKSGFTAGCPPFLFSVDLEDVRCLIPDGKRYPDRILSNTVRYLDFLSKHDTRCTFFTVGDIARRYPDLIKRILGEGHEIACHGNNHITLDHLDPRSFQRDVEQNLECLNRAGAGKICGFRAPAFSLTRQGMWAYEILAKLGFTYSSSVLPAKNPIYGWPDFGCNCQKVASKVWEIPLSLSAFGFFNVPFSGGVYFRALPFRLVRYFFRRELLEKRPVVGYFHPHDIDVKEERFMYPLIRNNKFYNWLMYYNRRGVFGRLSALFQNVPVMKYSEYVLQCLETGKGERVAG